MRSIGLSLIIGILVALCGCNQSGTTGAPGAGGYSPGGAVSETISAPPTSASITIPEGSLALTPQNTKITFIGTKPGGKHDGGFHKFTGAIDIKEDGGTVVVEIDTDSLWSDTNKLTNHLKSPDFFEVRTYPKATFQSTKIAKGGQGDATHTITGDLTLHGITRSISFPAKVTQTADGLKLDSTFQINRQDFKISYGPGKVDDPVTITVAVNTTK
jgi:polyisoprenoid-binding protein YceI